MPEGLWKLLDRLLNPAALKAIQLPAIILLSLGVYLLDARLRVMEQDKAVTYEQRKQEVAAIQDLTQEIKKYREAYIENARKTEEWVIAERRRLSEARGRGGNGVAVP